MIYTLLPVNDMFHRETGIDGTVFCDKQYFMSTHLVSDRLPVIDAGYKNSDGRCIGNHCIFMHNNH